MQFISAGFEGLICGAVRNAIVNLGDKGSPRFCSVDKPWYRDCIQVNVALLIFTLEFLSDVFQRHTMRQNAICSVHFINSTECVMKRVSVLPLMLALLGLQGIRLSSLSRGNYAISRSKNSIILSRIIDIK